MGITALLLALTLDAASVTGQDVCALLGRELGLPWSGGDQADKRVSLRGFRGTPGELVELLKCAGLCVTTNGLVTTERCYERRLWRPQCVPCSQLRELLQDERGGVGSSTPAPPSPDVGPSVPGTILEGQTRRDKVSTVGELRTSCTLDGWLEISGDPGLVARMYSRLALYDRQRRAWVELVVLNASNQEARDGNVSASWYGVSLGERVGLTFPIQSRTFRLSASAGRVKLAGSVVTSFGSALRPGSKLSYSSGDNLAFASSRTDLPSGGSVVSRTDVERISTGIGIEGVTRDLAGVLDCDLRLRVAALSGFSDIGGNQVPNVVENVFGGTWRATPEWSLILVTTGQERQDARRGWLLFGSISRSAVERRLGLFGRARWDGENYQESE